MTKNIQTARKQPNRPVRQSLLRPEEFAADVEREWLAEGILVKDSPTVLAGDRQRLSWFGADLAVSLATGTPFLGHFSVPRLRRVAYYSPERAFMDLRAMVHVVARSRGANLSTSGLRLAQQGAAFRTQVDWEAELENVKREEVEVVIIDPIRGALKSGSTPGEYWLDVDRLVAIGDAFLAAGVTPVFTHWTQWKSGSPQLADLAMLGLRDYARQWILFDHTGSTKKDKPVGCRLHAGGFAGHTGEWSVRTTVGRLQPDFSGLSWDVTVTDEGTNLPASPARTTNAESMEDIAEEFKKKKIVNRGNRITKR